MNKINKESTTIERVFRKKEGKERTSSYKKPISTPKIKKSENTVVKKEIKKAVPEVKTVKPIATNPQKITSIIEKKEISNNINLDGGTF